MKSVQVTLATLLLVILILSLDAMCQGDVKPLVVSVDSMTGKRCPACERLKHHLVNVWGASLVPRYAESTDKAPEAFPTVRYSYGKPDHGERIYSGKADVPKRVTVIEWE